MTLEELDKDINKKIAENEEFVRYTFFELKVRHNLSEDEIDKLSHIVCRGGSCIVDPYGHYVTEPVWEKEEIIYADLDMQKVPMCRMELDPCGHYARPDVLELKINEK